MARKKTHHEIWLEYGKTAQPIYRGTTTTPTTPTITASDFQVGEPVPTLSEDYESQGGQWTSFNEWVAMNHPGTVIGSDEYYSLFPGFEAWQTSQGYPTATSQVTPTVPTVPTTIAPTAPTGVMPTPTMPAITPPTITPAPAYEISPEMQEIMDLYGDKLTDWVTSGGYGLSPEVQAQMIQQQTDTLKAREAENIRVMRNNMERRGITNSGFLLSAENTIHSNTSVAIAGAIADVQIKSALMKMASFEKGMGAMAQFLGFLSEQSQLAYAPEFATWQAEQLATMQTWQAQIDLLKMEINQAYQTQNILLQGQLTSDLAEQQQGYNIALAEMEIEANQQAATAQGVGSIFGTVLGFLFGK